MKKFALIWCSDNMLLEYRDYMLGQLSDDTGQWDVLSPADPNFAEQVKDYDGYVISGSEKSVVDDLDAPLTQRLFAFIRDVRATSAAPVVGICFGAQALAAALDGRVGRNESGQFRLGVESLKWLSPSITRPNPRPEKCRRGSATVAKNGAPARSTIRERHMYVTRLIIHAAIASLMASGPALAHSTGPLGKIEHGWKPSPEIKRTVSLNFDFHGGGNFISWSPSARMTQHENRQCITGAYLLFDVDDRFAFDIDETILVDLTFFRPETDGFVFSYDQAVQPTAKKVRFDANNKGSWHTETVRLDRARFANRKYYGTDFAVGGLGSQLPRSNDGGEVTLCDVKVRREASKPQAPSPGKFALQVLDEAGRPTAARVGLYRSDGWAPLAGRSALTVQRYTEYTRNLPMVSVPKGWSANGRYVFFVDTNYAADVPAGEYDLFVMKGPEYRIQKRKVRIAPGTPQSIQVKMERWTDLPKQGWLSGDDHIHIGRSTPAENDKILAYMRAEDLGVANLLEAGNLKGSQFKQYGFGKEGHYGNGGHFLVSGQESPRTSHRGHSIGLNAKKFHWPEKDYFIYDATSDMIRADGGLWGYAHVALDIFNVDYSLALDVPRGKVDFVEMLQYGTMNTAYLYDFLNMGFKLLPSAGSDYPYIDFPGAERVYVDVGGSPSPSAWFDGLRSRRSFITNWLSADYSVNGDKKATEYHIRAGDEITVDAVIRANPDFDAIDRAELVGHGEVLKLVSGTSHASELRLLHKFKPSGSMWLAVRAYGKGRALLHTSPIYVYVDGNKDFSDRQKLAGLADKYRKTLAEFRNSTPRLEDEADRFAVGDLILARWNVVKPQLDKAIDDAIAIYDRLAAH